jgi:hypothetical protein
MRKSTGELSLPCANGQAKESIANGTHELKAQKEYAGFQLVRVTLTSILVISRLWRTFSILDASATKSPHIPSL